MCGRCCLWSTFGHITHFGTHTCACMAGSLTSLGEQVLPWPVIRSLGKQAFLLDDVGNVMQARWGRLDEVSNLPAVLDARLWRDDIADCEMWDGHRHGTVLDIADMMYAMMYAKMYVKVMVRLRYDYEHDYGLPVSYRPALGKVGLWFELEMDWPPQPLHSCAPVFVGVADIIVVLAERKLTSYVYAVGGSLQSWYQNGFLQSDFTVCLPSPPSLVSDMDPARVDEDRDAVASFYESHPLLFDGTRRTVSLAAWLYDMELIFRTSHIEARLQEAMLPHISQDIVSPGMQALLILRNGLPPQIRQYVAPMPDMTVGHIIDDIMEAEIVAHAMQADAYMDDHQVPVDDVGMREPLFEARPVFPEDPIPVVPLQEVLAPEAEVEVEADYQDAADDIVAPEDQPEDPPVIDISSDDEDDGVEHEPGYGGWLDKIVEFEDDPEEILFDDGDWDVDSDASSVVTIEYID
ncbi:hypothetical protein TIFTF001_041974 [Ficus carica]|uniref:Uncharacterized protein n=1 Tax=Ficus carica TaxID=3494 RepID=A0AA88CXV6_FICCA|nr:hypothetical protein TIFTF001_041974 [Ficus carica]